MTRELFDAGRESPEGLAAAKIARARQAIEAQRRRWAGRVERSVRRGKSIESHERERMNGRSDALAWVLELLQ